MNDTASDPLPIPPHLCTGATPLRFILYAAQGRFRWVIRALVVGESANAACGIMLPYALGRIIARVTASNEAGTALGSVWRPVALFAALCAGELVFGRINSALQLRFAPLQRQYVARALFRHLHGHSHRFLTESFAGALAHRINETSHGVNQVLWSLIQEFLPIGIVITVANILLLTGASPWLGLFTATWSFAFVAASLVLARRTQPLAYAASHARSRTAGLIVDSVSNHATVRLFAAFEYERDRLDRAYVEELGTVLRANRAMENVRVFQFAASAVLKAGTVGVAVFLWSRGKLGVGAFVMAVSLALLIIAEVRNLSRRFLDLFEALGNVGGGVRAILHPHALPDAESARERPFSAGRIEFDDVHFEYGDGAPVFRGLSITIPAGQRVGLVGLSGSGKSTFVNLLLRLYDPQIGTIRIDGHELPNLLQDSLHRQVGLIPQDPTLFHRSVRENIRYGRPDASDTEVEEAARRAHADEFIREIPEGYDAQVGERGVKLSGGQRQRIAIARVLLKNAPLLVLDEATSSLDSITERQIQEALDRAMAGKTVVVIAHRLATVAHLDRILVFAHGAVVEDGSHAELVARGGAYSALWSRQSGGRLPEEPPAPRPTRSPHLAAHATHNNPTLGESS
jgi:ATP-binding cassette subfamily B protein